MRKTMKYVSGWLLSLAGAATAVAGQDPTLPPAPMPPGANSALYTGEEMPIPDSGLTVPSVNSAAPSQQMTAPSNATSTSPCPCEENGRGWGCHHGVDCYGVRPLGACVAAQICTQVHNGLAAQSVLYNYDFNDPMVGDPTKLSLYGMRHLQEIEGYLRCGCVGTVTIEQNLGSSALDAARQMHVITALGEAGLAPQVAVGDTGLGLRGSEALLIHATRLKNFAAGGPTFNRQTSTNTGTGTGGSGGGEGGATSSGSQ